MNDIFPIGSSLVAYLRDSGGDSQDLSISQQREAIEKWCRDNNYLLTRTFEDIARSGASTVGRDKFLQMIEYFQNHPKEKGVVLWEYARMSRDYDDLLFYVSDLKRQGYIVHSISDSVPAGLEGSLVLGVRAYANAKFLQDLKRNVKRGLHYVNRNYHAYTGIVPVGYKLKTENIGKRRDGSPHTISHLVPNKKTAPKVIKAFELRAMGYTYKEVSEETRIYKWHSHYKRLFENKLYMGVREYGGETITNYCPPLVSKELWEKVNQMQEKRGTRAGINHPRTVRSTYWLTGVIYCARCGSPVHGGLVGGKDGRILYYHCNSHLQVNKCDNGSIPKVEIEQRVMDALSLLIQDERIIQQVYEEALVIQSRSTQTKQETMNRLYKDKKEIEREINFILRAIREAGHSRALLEDLNKLETKRDDIESQINKIDSETPTQNITPYKFEDIRKVIGQAIYEINDIERGMIAREIIKRVEVARIKKQLSGKIIILPPGLSEITIQL